MTSISTTTSSKIEARTLFLLSIRENGIGSDNWAPSTEEMAELWDCDARELRYTLLLMEGALPGDPTLDAFFNAINSRLLPGGSLEDRRRDFMAAFDPYARAWTDLFNLEKSGARTIALIFDHFRKNLKFLSEVRRIMLNQGLLSPTYKALGDALDDAEL